MPAVVTIKDLSIRFRRNGPSTPAIDHLSLEIGSGEFLALVGESGSGKSITALSLLQLLPRTKEIEVEGSIQFHTTDGQSWELRQLQEREMNNVRGKNIGMVFQEPMTALNPLLRCGEQIAEVIRTHKNISRKQARKETLEWMNRVQLPDPRTLYERYPHELSGGQKQRIGIAAAICCGPQLLICDEPTTALDVTVQKEILELIRSEQKKTGMAVLFISHDLALVSQYADRVAVLLQGKLVETGLNPRIFQNPTSPYTRALIACRPAAHARGQRLPLVSDFLSPEPKKQYPTQKAIHLPSSETFLQVENLSVGYPPKNHWIGSSHPYKPVVRSVSFNILKGEILGVVGESGSGKSTLGRALLGLVKPMAGSIWYQQYDLLNRNPHTWPLKRHQLQLVFQDPYSSLNPRMSIGEAIGEPLRIHGKVGSKQEEKREVCQWLERVQLKKEHFDRYPHEFSGGQRQRIVIARALALKPAFVVCDESVSALDVSIQAQVLNLLNDLRQELKFTTLFISHDLGVIRYLCERMIVLKEGRIQESGETDRICAAPEDPYTLNLIQSIPQLQSAG